VFVYDDLPFWNLDNMCFYVHCKFMSHSNINHFQQVCAAGRRRRRQCQEGRAVNPLHCLHGIGLGTAAPAANLAGAMIAQNDVDMHAFRPGIYNS
jgi:hypothetical protein